MSFSDAQIDERIEGIRAGHEVAWMNFGAETEQMCRMILSEILSVEGAIRYIELKNNLAHKIVQ